MGEKHHGAAGGVSNGAHYDNGAAGTGTTYPTTATPLASDRV